MARNILEWFRLHKKLSIIIVLMISCISCSLLIIANDIYYGCQYKGREGEYRIRFDKAVSFEEFVNGYLSEFNKNGVEFESLSVASGQGNSNKWLYSAELIGENVRFMFGALPKKANECMRYFGFTESSDTMELFGESFAVTGCGMLWNCASDYTLFVEDYAKRVGIVEYMGLTAAPDSEEAMLSIVRARCPDAEITDFNGFSSGEFEARRNMLYTQLMIIVISLAFVMMIIGIVVDLQKKDIYVYHLCGGSAGRISASYFLAISILPLVSEAIGYGAFCLVKSLGLVTFSEENCVWLYIAVLTTELFFVEALLILTIKSICKRICENYREALL